MALHNINEIEFETFNAAGIPALFSSVRFDKDTLPDGYYAYDVRGSDYDSGKPTTLEPFVFVNYIGTIVTRTPIEFEQAEDKYKELGDDWSYSYPINEFGDKFSYCPRADAWRCIA